MLLWEIFHSPTLMQIVFAWDPLPISLADKVVSVVFDQRRIAPTSSEALVFVVADLVGFGIECSALGALVGLLRLGLVRRPHIAFR